MKTNSAKHLLTAVPAILLLAAGCSQEFPEIPSNSDQQLMTVRIVDEPLDTRASYDNILGKFKWTAGDQIKVPYLNDRVETYDIVVNSDTPSVATILSSIKGDDVRTFYAVFPAAAWVAPASGATAPTVNLKARYDFSEIIAGTSVLTADYAPLPMVAKNDPSSNVLDFHHVGGLLRINCVDMDPATKTIVVSFDKDVTGDYLVDVTDPDAPFIETAGASSNNAVTFVVSATSAGVGTHTSFYLNLPLPCGTYEYVKVESFDSRGNSLLTREFNSYPLILARHHGKRISFMELDWVYNLDGNFSDAEETYTGGVQDISMDMTSYKVDSDGNKVPVPFEIQWSPDGTDGSWTTDRPDWVLMGGGIDYDGSSSVPQTIKVALSPQTNSIPMNDFGAPLDKHTLKLQAASPKTDFDLSRFNVATGSVTTEQTTANCYVIQAPGTYKFPLVYGNGVTGGAVNSQAFHARDSHGSWQDSDVVRYTPDGYNLGYFKDHLGEDIKTPYIAEQLAGKTPSRSIARASLLWTDAKGLIESVSYSPGDEYVHFTVTQAGISQGNAVIAVYDNTGLIAWSWHIWVTDDDFTQVGDVMNGRSVTALDLGWCDQRVVAKYEARDCYMRIVQTDLGGKVSNPVHIVMEEGPTVVRGGHNPFYQYGRKDPLPGPNGDMELPEDKPCYTITGEPFKHHYANPVSGSLALSIQNPDTHYINEGGNSWSNPSYFNSWNSTAAQSTSSVTKTIYDPSPVGYKVPPYTAYQGSTMSNTGYFRWVDNYIMDMVDKDGNTYGQEMGPGRVFKGLFFPASGTRKYTVEGYGIYGQYITATTSWYLNGYGSMYIRYTPYTIIATSGASSSCQSLRCTPDR